MVLEKTRTRQLTLLMFSGEFLKLDKWLTDKIREHGEPFISACIKFLQRRCPQLVGGKEDMLPKSSQLPQETMTTILVCLNACTMLVSLFFTCLNLCICIRLCFVC